jgi:hypothetical protein
MVTDTVLQPAPGGVGPVSPFRGEQSAGVLPTGTPSWRRRLASRRSLSVALGVLWLLDGALQLQPFMFTRGFATSIIAPAATGQPRFVADAVEWNARVIGGHAVLFNALFASFQLALGLAFLFRRTTRPAVVASVAWAGGVWYLGEGLGGVFGLHGTALVGAPGAALLYAVLALAAWPRADRVNTGPEPGRRQLLPQWTLGAWAALWVGSAALSALPSNASSRAIAGQLNGNASTAPSWLAAVDRSLATAVHASGPVATVLTVVVELAIGLLVFAPRPMRTGALWTGMVVAVVYWAAGQSFGQLFSGQATDPSTGPLVVLLGLVVLGACRPGSSPTAPSGGRSPDGSVDRRPSEGCATTVR